MSTAIRARPTLNVAAGRERAQFISQFHAICGHERVQLLWLPKGTDTTTSTSEDRGGKVLTWGATIAARLSALGMGYAVSFNGTSQYATTPDVDALSFGDGLNDSPFSVGALCTGPVDAPQRALLSKHEATTGDTKREWVLRYNSTTKYLSFVTADESASGQSVGRFYGTAITASAWRLLTGTCDGTRWITSCAVHENSTRRDDTNTGGGSYVAMENTGSLVYLGAIKGATAITEYFSGSMALAYVVSRQLQPDDLWALTNLCNWYFNLSLTV